MEDFIPQKSTDDQAEFNNAFAFLERLNKEEYMIEDNLMNWRLNDAFCVLETYENELCFSFKGDDQKNVNDLKNKISLLMNDNPNLGQKRRDARGKEYLVGKEKLGEVRELLVQLNKLLRHIKHKRGMGMPTRGEGKLF